MLNIEIADERTARRETFIETDYIGSVRELLGTSGVCYLHLKDGQWMYRPEGADEDDWYRVKGVNLSCNNENGWIKCDYLGKNGLFGATGKAFFNEVENVWFYKPKGSKDLFRAGDGKNLKFLRDKDVELDN